MSERTGVDMVLAREIGKALSSLPHEMDIPMEDGPGFGHSQMTPQEESRLFALLEGRGIPRDAPNES